MYGDWLHSSVSDAPTILIYGHYDVQPADPAGGAWTTPPFSPTIRDKSVYARGASDDKGPIIGVISALESIFATSDAKELPVNVKLFFEGEEEIGSPTMDAIMKKFGDSMFRADYAFSADGGQPGRDAPPGLIVGLRGNLGLEIKVSRQGGDLHSGVFGGAVGNPLHHLVKILDSLRDKETGRVLVDGFYDDVDAITEKENKDLDTFEKHIPFESLLKSLGTNSSYGEKGFSPYERVWLRPTLEIVGLNGGYTGEGIKTVLPREASCKIACRLVTSQKATDVSEKIATFVGKFKAPGLDVEVIPLHFQANPSRIRRDGVANEAARTVLKELFNAEPIFFYMGGSVPAVEIIQRRLGIDTVTFNFDSPGTNIHGPDEFARLEDLEMTRKGYVKLFFEVSAKHGKMSGTLNEARKDEL